MVEWSEPPELGPNDIKKIWRELNLEILDNPSFEWVAHLSKEHLAEHAKEVLESYFSDEEAKRTTSTYQNDEDLFVQVYAMAFIMGTRFGQSTGRDT